ncbi:MAG: FtsX-like permease family protein, partial [Terriglobales bacterium]
LLRSYLGVLGVPLGFEPARAASIKLTYDTRAKPAQRYASFEQAVNAVEALPGVEAAGIADFLPLGRNRSWGPLVPKGHMYSPGEARSAPLVYVITPEFFRAMGIGMVAGRDFTWDDGPTHAREVIINEGLAKALWPGGNAVGQSVGQNPDLKVVGVVADVRETGIEGAPGWQAYYPAGQNGPDDARLVIRSRLPASTLAPSVMAALRQLNPEQAAASLVPIQQIVDHATSPRRFFLEFVLAFGGFGLLLAGLGLYGVISYAVTRRQQEIGVRMALGASAARVRAMILRESLALALAGIGLGLAGALALGGLLSALLFDVSPADPLTFAATAVVLAAAALLAAHLPARRAARIEPMAALRGD